MRIVAVPAEHTWTGVGQMRKHYAESTGCSGRDDSHAGDDQESDDSAHDLWLIYCQLKDAESDSNRRLELLQQSREELGRVLNALNCRCESKGTCRG